MVLVLIGRMTGELNGPVSLSAGIICSQPYRRLHRVALLRLQRASPSAQQRPHYQ